MKKYLATSIGRLRVIAFLEGVSLLLLLFIAMPFKYIWGNPSLVRSIGMIHGLLFLIFVAGALRVSAEQRWKFTITTWKVLLASIIPFGTFYIDYKILRNIPDDQK